MLFVRCIYLIHYDIWQCWYMQSYHILSCPWSPNRLIFIWKAPACLPDVCYFFIACLCWVMINSYSWLKFYYLWNYMLLFYNLRILSILLLRTESTKSSTPMSHKISWEFWDSQGPFLRDQSVPWFWWKLLFLFSKPLGNLGVFVFMQIALTFLPNYIPVITVVSVFPISYPSDTLLFHLLKMSFTFPPLYLC